MYFYFYHAAMMFSLVASLTVVVLMWRRRQAPGAGAMLALAVATFVWTLAFLIEARSDTLEQQMVFNNIGYLGSMCVPVAWLYFALRYNNIGWLLRGWKVLLFCIVPVVTTVLIWTNGAHHLMWSNEHLEPSGGFIVTVRIYGPFFWVALANNYLLVLAGAVILLSRLFIGTRLYIRQAIVLIVVVSLPLIWNAIGVFDLFSLPHKDLTPVMFAISAIAIVLGLLRFHLFSTIPFARKFVVKQLRDGVLVFNVDNCLVEANPMVLQMLQLDESIIGKKLEELRPLSPLFEFIATAGFGRAELKLNVAGHGRCYDLETTPMMLEDRSQQVGWLAIVRDFTERKRAEEQYRLVTENSADVIYKMNIAEERFTYVSPSVIQLLGYAEKDIDKLKLKDVITPESYQLQFAELAKNIDDGTESSILQLELVHKNGHIVPVEIHASIVRDGHGTPTEIVGVARDITERKRLEEQLIMQDRLASIGQLSSGIAHELNNPLTGVVTFSALLLERDLPDDIKEDLNIICQEAQRTAKIVKNLLTFARKQPQEKQPADINEVVRKILELRAYEQKVNNIQVDVRLAEGLPSIMGNSSQIEQVFFNIVINAEFFMLEAHGKGTLTITTEDAGSVVRVSFADDGPGVSAENLRHLFNPFFSTKEIGKGTGLGLSICHGIITEHGGRVWAESEEGKGTVFFVELPVYNNDALLGAGDSKAE